MTKCQSDLVVIFRADQSKDHPVQIMQNMQSMQNKQIKQNMQN